MRERIRKAVDSIFPRFQQGDSNQVFPFVSFRDYRQIWGMGIFSLMAAALLPLFVMTGIFYQLIATSIDTESLLRTERLTSNTRRAVSFFLEERLAALKFTVNEVSYEALNAPDHLAEVLKNMKLGFGGLTDLSVIDHTGTQVTYAGPYNLEGKNYSQQSWFRECVKQNAYVSEIIPGFREIPHIVIAVKSTRADGNFFILRATLETNRLIQTISTYETGEHVEIFLVNHQGVYQTPSKHSSWIPSGKMSMNVPEYSSRTEAKLSVDEQGQSIVVGYAYISTNIAPTPFILMVVKQKTGMMKVWVNLKSDINWLLVTSVAVIALVVTLTSTFMVNKIYAADRAKARTMTLVEQHSQLASIGQLAAGVAHEINNPLALINQTAGYVKDLFIIEQKYEDDPELVEHLDSILDAVDRCGTITRQLLGFARQFDVQSQSINLKEMISNVLNFHKKEAAYRNITVNVDVPEDLPMIETDRGKLQQILLNLINNAFQAIENGCFLNVRAEMAGPESIRLIIQDNGCGISEEYLNKIFEPFFTTKKEGRGTGLGLSITYGLVRKLKGDISAESKVGEGTTFTVTLPVRLEKETHP